MITFTIQHQLIIKLINVSMIDVVLIVHPPMSVSNFPTYPFKLSFYGDPIRCLPIQTIIFFFAINHHPKSFYNIFYI